MLGTWLLAIICGCALGALECWVYSICAARTKYEPDYTDFFPVRSNVISLHKGYQPLPVPEHSPPPRSVSAIIPTRCILSQMDEMIDALQSQYNTDIVEPGHMFVLSSAYYEQFYHEAILHRLDIADENGQTFYRSVPVIKSADVIGGLVLRPKSIFCDGKSGQSNIALISLMKSIESEMHNRHVMALPMPYLAIVEEDTPMLDDEYADGGKVSDGGTWGNKILAFYHPELTKGY